MKLKKGDTVPHIELPDINGNAFQLSELQGKRLLLTFYRFASCPFCNLRLHQIANRYGELGEMVHVAIFSGSVHQLNQHTSKHKDLFPILADEQEHYYRQITVERSWKGMLKGVFGRMPHLLKSMSMGHIPREFGHRMLLMPVDILVDEHGRIADIKYGTDEGDHIAMNDVLAFARASG